MTDTSDDSSGGPDGKKSRLEEVHELLETEITERKRVEEMQRASEARLRTLTSQLSLAEERERRQIAAELHDNVGQILAMMKMTLVRLERMEISGEVAETVQKLKGLCEEAIGGTRFLISELSPPVLYELGFEAAVSWLAEKHEEKHGVRVVIDDDSQSKPLSNDVRVFLFQAVRELLMNAAKHAQVDQVKISLERGREGIRITVADQGRGFDTSELKKSGGFGLYNIGERLNTVGGSFSVESEPGRGTRVILLAPLKSD
jgi:signal transduction histidine kinase